MCRLSYANRISINQPLIQVTYLLLGSRTEGPSKAALPQPCAPAGDPQIWPGTHSRWALGEQSWGQGTSEPEAEKRESNVMLH